ncbi:MAG: aminotransferase class I/II-fold pyridoxal phosphate-dependent enzyme [Deltaproteobacteria bacterium]|nr:aminotransferase class I/II-fold pyridoxal phosphate-dependent enzyme [Deltaproteobacteria bacterium]
MDRHFNTRLNAWDDSALLELFKPENMRRPENINFGIGEMDFVTPRPIIDACKGALDRGFTFYAPTLGVPELRRALADSAGKEYGIPLSQDEIFVTPGGTNAIFDTILSLMDAGEEVLYPDPGFPAYMPQIILAGGVPVPYPLTGERDFVPDPEEIRRRITQKTKILILNSPSNPVGNIIPVETLAEIAKIVQEKDLWVLSDEAYKHIVYPPDTHTTILTVPGMRERTVVACTFSKTFAMTGWRLGYLIAPPRFAGAFFKVFQYSVTSVSAFIQVAAADAVRQGRPLYEDILTRMTARRDCMERELRDAPGVSFPKPQAAFYVFLNVKATGLPSMEVSKRLLEDYALVTIPGRLFGEHGEGYLRLSYAIDEEKVKEGAARLKKALEKLIP